MSHATGEQPKGLRPLPTQIDLPAMEQEVLRLWAEQDVFSRSLEHSAGSPQWTFYEGPPTANGMPGTHHVEARVFKDVFPRYRTMKGYHVPRKGGWDCHGLPVEIAVEKELGFAGKGDIEAFGVAEFNERCRESVLRHVDAFEQMTERMGFWVDTSQAYRTMDAEYVQSVWWSLKQIFDKGLLSEDHRVTPYCPRCGTSLSDHELGQPGGYETVVDPSVYVRFPITSGPLAGTADLLVWTTTPWTLVSNTAVAVHPDVTYVLVEHPDHPRPVIVAEPLVQAAVGESSTVLGSYSGKDLERWAYEPPFDLVDIPDAHYVVLGGYVTTEDGTGLVHQAPAFGADDLDVCRRYGLPVVNPVGTDGRFAADLRLIGGQFFKHADTDLVADLDSRGRLARHVPYEHSYPHCWRCHTPLLYYAQPSWYIRTTAVKEQLLEQNDATNWYPPSVKWGRYGDWLRNNVDWALSRNRFWGTPLPIWVNDQDRSQTICVGSLAELGELAGQDLSALDPHRPYVDDVTFELPGTPGVFRRVPEVIDVWYDSGAMPFAQWGYPHAPGSVEAFEAAYPAQFICEALDQTRGWFYTLMAVGTMVFDKSSYENVLCLGLILAEDGRKMSKHLGNVIEPIPLMDEHGADAVRWFMAASGSPWLPRRVGDAAIADVVRKVLLTYWNTASFFSLYGSVAGWTPEQPTPPVAERPVQDRWVLSELNRLIAEVDSALDGYDTARAGQLLAAFVDDLSNWYVRRSRRRFWDGDAAALDTLYTCLHTVSRLLAPLVPFITERVWQDVVRPCDTSAVSSVHLADFPQPDESLVREDLAEAMSLTRRLVELGRAARASSKVKVRQPLARAVIGAPGWDDLGPELRAEIAEELNVVALEDIAQAAGGLTDVSVKANFRALGKRFGPQTPKIAAAITAADPVSLAEDIRSGEASLDVPDVGPVSLSADDLVITETPAQGWAVAREGETVALDLALTPELTMLGLVREAVRRIQDARKGAGLEVTDRISLVWDAEGEMAAALEKHADAVAAEVLATEVSRGPATADGPAADADVVDSELGLRLWISRASEQAVAH